MPIYTDHAEVFLLDEEGNRYLMSEEDKLYHLMHGENFLDACYEIGSDNPAHTYLVSPSDPIAFPSVLQGTDADLPHSNKPPAIRLHNERLLQYLAEQYNGTTAEMYELWQAAKARELDTLPAEVYALQTL